MRERIVPALLAIGALGVLPAIDSGAADRQGPFGGEFRVEEGGRCVPDELRAKIRAEADHNIVKLQALGLLTEPTLDEPGPLLSWPLRPAAALRDFDYYATVYFVDQQPAGLLDYACDVRTYDGHRGTDYSTWPFYWMKMDEDLVDIVAAAPGVIAYRADGRYDRQCDWNDCNWNAVLVRHADGSEAWYGHMKNGSVTPKTVGATVERGEYLGILGSSGCSTIPHLHFEIWDSGENLNDPYAGACNSLNNDSWWGNQLPYYDSRVNRLATAHTVPYFPACPLREWPNEAKDFNFGDTIYFVVYYRDQRETQTTVYTIYRPDGAVFDTWSHDISPVPYYNSSWWYWSYTNFAATGPAGVWTFTADFNGRVYERQFRVDAAAGSGRVPGQLNESSGLTVERSGADLTLSWSSSCAQGDTDYEVYEGSIGTWYSHAPLSCSTGGAISTTVAPGVGNHYYLVVPTDTTVEGSYGVDGDLMERPAAATGCLPQQIGGICPKCGNGLIEHVEVCDATNLTGESCLSQGFDAGTLICAADCRGFDVSFCSTCGNDFCEGHGGENCLTCPADCNGRQGGGNPYCCGDGGGENPVPCEDSRCTAGGKTCLD
jgi:hypothetical protein